MAESKESKPGDLSTLDGDALVARLGIVKQHMLDLMDQPSALMLVARVDSEAVLDECGIRLLDPGPEHLRAQILGDDVGRLRALIRATVGPIELGQSAPTVAGECFWCFAKIETMPDREGDPHKASCPWPELVAEASKP